MVALDVDGANCVCCGICRDCCPPAALQMRVQTRPGVEVLLFVTATARFETFPFLAAPASCDGCMICVRECPVGALGLRSLGSQEPRPLTLVPSMPAAPDGDALDFAIEPGQLPSGGWPASDGSGGT